MALVFRQNDVYDDMKIVKMETLNLKEEETKLLTNQVNNDTLTTFEAES